MEGIWKIFRDAASPFLFDGALRPTRQTKMAFESESKSHQSASTSIGMSEESAPPTRDSLAPPPPPPTTSRYRLDLESGAMPFKPFSSSSNSSSSNLHNNAAQSGIIQAAQALGSIGAPQGNLRHSFQQQPSNQNSSNQGPIPHHPFGSIMATSSNNPGAFPSLSNNTQPSQQYESGRRSQYGRQPDELHMGPKIEVKPEDQYSSQYGRHPTELHGGPKIEVKPEEEYSSPAHLGNSQIGGSGGSGGNLPGTLQPGRPGLNTNMSSEYKSSSRSNSYTHNYSRSSPAAPAGGFESAQSTQYTYPPTPGNLAAEPFASPTQKYTPGQQRNVPNTPLGLADIRPRADSSVGEPLLPGANPYSYDGTNAVPTNSNYLAPWALYAFDWCKWPAQNGEAGKLAVGSYLEDGHNFIQILDSKISPQDPYTPGGPKYGLEFTKIAEATHSYPVTRLLWEPPSSQKQSTDLLATSGDHLRLWSLPKPEDSEHGTPSSSIHRGQSANSTSSPSTKLSPLALLSNSKTPEHTAPLTSLDWNTVSPSLIITSSIDTTCTIWDIPTLTAKTQLIAHDKEVFDVRFCANSTDVFVSCGADGSVRMFDLRSLEHSTIIYEPSAKDDKDGSPSAGRISPTLAQQTLSYAPPLLRLAASPHDTHLLATFSQDSSIIRILDVRQPGQALLELKGHGAAINCIEWSPSRRGMLASGADDSLVLVWDLLNQNNNLTSNVQNASVNGSATTENSRSPAASWKCDYEVGNISWAPHSALSSDGDWIGVSGGRGIWGVKL